MSDRYTYRKTTRRYPRSVLRRRLSVAVGIAGLAGLAVFGLIYDLGSSAVIETPTSSFVQSEVSEGIQTFKSAYFQFSDSGKWVYSNVDSTDNQFVYYKYRGHIIEQRLTIYIDQTPIPLHLATTRVLPVRIVNASSLDVTNVAGPCVSQYGAAELHKVKNVTIQAAIMLCDPDSPLYTVMLSEIDGDYSLNFRRSSGLPIQIVVTYQDMRLDPDASTIRRVANSFQIL